jgi:hypothetical protein
MWALDELGSKLFRDIGNPVDLRSRSDVQHGRSSRSDKREAPLGCNRRRRQSLRHGDTELIYPLFLCAAPDDTDIRELTAHSLKKRALAAVGLEQDHLALRESGSQRKARRPAARTHIDDRAVEAGDDIRRPEAVLEEDTVRFIPVADRSQPGRLEDAPEPISQTRVRLPAR